MNAVLEFSDLLCTQSAFQELFTLRFKLHAETEERLSIILEGMYNTSMSNPFNDIALHEALTKATITQAQQLVDGGLNKNWASSRQRQWQCKCCV
jgi:hypothetical protein